jgi:glycosyltransferase involved in cell wall biosynthesis
MPDNASFSVSVVTPVYNAADFVSRAVEAAVAEEEVAEVLLVEDASTDNSLEVCKELDRRHGKVRVIQHPDRKNHGAGETRNLGIPGRFKLDRKLLMEDSTIDGVYHAQGIHYYSEKARKCFFEAGLGDGAFLSVSAPVSPEELIYVFLGIHPVAKVLGGLGIDAITLRRRAFDKAGLFEPRLRLQQDVHLFFRLAAACRMAPGKLQDPVAVRGVHETMRSTNPEKMAVYERHRWDLLKEWFAAAPIRPEVGTAFRRSYWQFRIKKTSTWQSRAIFLGYALTHPSIVLEAMGFFDQNLLNCFGRNWFTLHATSAKNRLLMRMRRKA